MPSVSSEAKGPRSRAERSADIRRGIRTGLQLALGLGGIAAVILIISAVHTRKGNPVVAWLLIATFYVVVGILGGALFGLLRPLRKHYLGRVLIAYLLLVLVYGGGTVAFYPLIAQRTNPPSLAALLIVWAVLSLLLAPIYVATVKGSALPELWDSSSKE